MQVSIGASTDADAHASQAPAESNLTVLAHPSVGTAVWEATGPLRPVLLSETERRFRFSGMPQAIGAARRSLREWERHFDPELFYDLSLCVSELVTKSVQQARPDESEEIELGVLRTAGLVRAEVLERRGDIVVTEPRVKDGHDWGMFIVDRVADRWGVDRTCGTRLWCEIDIAADGRSRGTPLAALQPLALL